jgi:hypothetical protein
MYMMPPLRAVSAEATDEKICVSETALDGTGFSKSLLLEASPMRAIVAM